MSPQTLLPTREHEQIMARLHNKTASPDDAYRAYWLIIDCERRILGLEHTQRHLRRAAWAAIGFATLLGVVALTAMVAP